MNELVALIDYKNFLKIDPTPNDTFDAILKTMKSEIEEKVFSRLKRDLFKQEYVEYYDGNGSNFLTPLQFPILSDPFPKVEVYWGLDNQFNDVWYEYTKGNYYQRLMVVNEVQLCMEGAVFPTGNQNIRITYTAGYDSIPLEIQKVCKELMKLYYDETPYGRDILGKSADSLSANGGNANITYDLKAEETILKRLDAYARIDI